MTETTDREGRVRTFTYDDLDRLTSETWLDGMTTVNTLIYTYDSVGNLLTGSDNDSSYAFEYDNLHRRTESDNAGTTGLPNVVLDSVYDAFGNRTSVSDGSGVTIDSVYDDLNRLKQRDWDGGSIDPARIDFEYDARGLRTAAHRYSDLSATTLIGSTNYGHDTVGRVNEMDHLDALDSAIAEYDYTYDLAGQITDWSHHGETIDFTHDDTGQLTAADYTTQTDESYAYDDNGNRTGTGITIGDNNQITSDGTYNYEYDDEGNLTLKTTLSSGEYTEYAYDHRNRMTSAKTYTSGAVLLQEVEFTYDLFDRRIAKTVDDDGAGPNTADTVYTVYDGDHAWADYDGLGAATARYLFGDRIDEIIARWQPINGTAWYLTDHLGTVRDLVDDSGTLINTITYDSFGVIVSQTSATDGDRFTYTGREYDSELGLYYYRARYYDARLGRFISQDPIGFDAGDANLYRYVGNQPTTTTDPSGLQPPGDEPFIPLNENKTPPRSSGIVPKDVPGNLSPGEMQDYLHDLDRSIQNRILDQGEMSEQRARTLEQMKAAGRSQREIDAFANETAWQNGRHRIRIRDDIDLRSKVANKLRKLGKVGGKVLAPVGVISGAAAAQRGFAGDGFREEGGVVASATEVGRDVFMVEEVNGGAEALLRWIVGLFGISDALDRAPDRIKNKINNPPDNSSSGDSVTGKSAVKK